MVKIRKLSAIILSSIILFSLQGCGKDNSTITTLNISVDEMGVPATSDTGTITYENTINSLLTYRNMIKIKSDNILHIFDRYTDDQKYKNGDIVDGCINKKDWYCITLSFTYNDQNIKNIKEHHDVYASGELDNNFITFFDDCYYYDDKYKDLKLFSFSSDNIGEDEYLKKLNNRICYLIYEDYIKYNTTHPIENDSVCTIEFSIYNNIKIVG